MSFLHNIWVMQIVSYFLNLGKGIMDKNIIIITWIWKKNLLSKAKIGIYVYFTVLFLSLALYVCICHYFWLPSLYCMSLCIKYIHYKITISNTQTITIPSVMSFAPKWYKFCSACVTRCVAHVSKTQVINLIR